mgnify:CR=1 FL=1|tara:strand:+ start:993 stop:1919 length:927 start_codon:yes stop_codon:yes gene_type:complete
MSQNDFTIANQGFPAFRSDLNGALQALATLSAGTSAPSTTFAYQLWYDSTNDILKIRNADDDAWITLFTFNQSTDSVQVSGEELVDDLTPQLGGPLDTNGKNITFGDSSGASDDRLTFGAGTDLSILHDGNHSYIQQSGTGELRLRQTTNDQDVIIESDDGSGGVAVYFRADGSTGETQLFHYGTEKLNTSATGVTVSGTAVATTNTDTSNSGTVTLDFGANQNFVLTITGAVTLGNPTTEQVGQSGFIVFIQDSSGGATISLGTQYKTAGGVNTLTLSSAAGAIDVVPYIVSAADSILLGAPQLNFS